MADGVYGLSNAKTDFCTTAQYPQWSYEESSMKKSRKQVKKAERKTLEGLYKLKMRQANEVGSQQLTSRKGDEII